VKHPGTITMVDADAKTEKKVAASSVPPSIAFIDDVAVVKIVTRKSVNGAREMSSYGADGALLSTTIAAG
jgi:hypothetical protein